MININLLKKKKIFYTLLNKNYKLNINLYSNLENKRKINQIYIEYLKNKKKKLSKKIGILKKSNLNNLNIIKKIFFINKKIKQKFIFYKNIKIKIKKFLLKIPNLYHKSVSINKKNIEIKKIGKIPIFNFKIKNHIDLGLNLGLNLKKPIKMVNSNFMILKNKIAKIYRSISQFMIDTHCYEHKYIEYYIPYIVNENSLIGTGQLPKFKKKLFMIKNKKKINSNLYLIPTSEVPLINLIKNKIFYLKKLPFKMVAYSPCFRYEKISYGKISQGIIRQYQFDKVEIVQITNSKKSYIILEEMLLHVENILNKLNLPYRVISLCSHELNFSSSKTYDIEVWLPSQNNYCEISSISNCEDFQSRRINAKFKDKNNKKKYVHTLNGSGLAIGRTLAAILENFQQKDGSIIIPKVLIPYMGGVKKIKPYKQ